MRIGKCLVCGMDIGEEDIVVRIDKGVIKRNYSGLRFRYLAPLIKEMIHQDCLVDYLDRYGIKGLLETNRYERHH